jgi:hypothetical protein
MGNWTLDSFISKQTAIMNRFVPPPPGATNPMDWGEEATVRQRFGDRAEVVCTRRTFVFDLPFAPEESAKFFGRYLGPAQVVFSRLDTDGRHQLSDALRESWVRENRGTSGRTLIETEYLEVHARPK